MLQLWKVTKLNIRDSTSQGKTVPKMNTHPAKGQYKKLLRLLSIFPLNLLFNQMHKISPKFLGFVPSKPKLKFRCFPLLLEPPQNFVVHLLTLKLKPESLQMLSQWIFIRQIKNRFTLAGIFALDKTWVKSSFCQCTQQLFPKWDRIFHFE